MNRLDVPALAIAFLMLGLGHTATAAVVKVDLSTTTGPKAGLTNWNYLVPNSSIGAGSVINANGSIVSGLSVSVNGNGAADNPDTATWTGFGNDPYYVPAAYDLIYAVNNGLGLLGTAREMNVSFSGLDTSKTYNARVYFLINEGLSNFDAAVSGQAGMVRNNDINRRQVFNEPYLDSRLVFTNVAPTTSGGNLIISVGAFDAVSLEAVVLEQPGNAYWAPASGAGGSGTWTQTSTVWSDSSNGSGQKGPWSNATGAGYFGGTAGTVTVTGTVGVNQAVFSTGGYVLESSGGRISYYASGTTATINAQTGLTTIAANQTAATGLRVTGNGTLALSATTTVGSGQSLVVDGGNLRVNGLVSGSVSVAAGSLGGSGRIQGTIGGAGSVNPGNSPGILTVESVDPSAGLDFALEFSGTAPNYGDATNSVNDVLRLTGSTPFTSALTTANTKTLFLNFTKAQLTQGTVLEGGFFTDTAFDFASLLNNQTWDNAGFQVYVLGDGAGTDNRLNGVGYYNWRNPAMFGWTQSLFMSTAPRTANFASGSEAGQVMLLTIAVPEPSTYFLTGMGMATIALLMRRRCVLRTRGSNARRGMLIFLLGIPCLAAASGSRSSVLAEEIAFFDLNGITNAQISTLQYQTGNQLVFGANLTDWTKSGHNAVHAIQLSGSTPGGPGNYAPMIFSDNFITQLTPFAANTKGTLYYVSYEIGPTVYTNPAQATTASDSLRINLLRTDDSILATNDVAPGAWAGVQTFTQTYFAYVGDGTGPLRIQMRSADPDSGRFSGAVDNMGFWTSNPVAPTYAYWSPTTGAGGNGTWNTANSFWAPNSDGGGSKQVWNNSSQTNAAFFGGVAGSVTLSGTLATNQMNFSTSGYTLTAGAGSGIAYNGSAPTITLGSGVSATIGVSQSGSQGVVINGAGVTSKVIFSGNNTYTGNTVVDTATLSVTGTIANSAVNVLANASLGGSGRIEGTISGAGSVNPGNSPGILTAAQVDPSGGLDFVLEYSGTAPNYANASASVNDVLRLTGGTPFTSALTAANTKTLFLNFTKNQLLLGGTNAITVLAGGFFTDVASDFTSLLNNQTWDNAGFQVYVLGDGLGTDNRLNGVGYYNWRNPAMFGWDQSLFLSTRPQTANFGSGDVNGQVMLLTVAVPEPSTYAMALSGLACGGYLVTRRRRRASRENPEPIADAAAT